MAQDNVDVVQGIWDAFSTRRHRRGARRIRCRRPRSWPRSPLPWGGPTPGRRAFGDFVAMLNEQLRGQFTAHPRQGPGRRRQPRDRRWRRSRGGPSGGATLENHARLALPAARRPGSPTPRPSATRRQVLRRSADASRSSSSPTTARDAVRTHAARAGGQLRADDELIVVDNASSDGTADARSRAGPDGDRDRGRLEPRLRRRLQPRGATAASSELLVFLNPDAVAAPGFREAIERPAEGGGWAAWQGLVTAEGERVINTRGGVVHFTGHRLGGRRGGAPRRGAACGARSEPGFVSGACLAIPRERFERARRLRRGLLPLPRGRRPLASRPARRAGGSGWSAPPASTTTTSSTRARPSGASWSATAGRRSSAPTRPRCSRSSRRHSRRRSSP